MLCFAVAFSFVAPWLCNSAAQFLQLAEEYKAQLNPPATWVSTRIHNAFVAGYQNASETLLGILLWFAEYSPTLLIRLAILAVPFVMIWRRYRRMSAAL